MTSITEAQKVCVAHGGFLAGVERFDGKCFGVSPAEANAMDPQQRLVLESAYEALHGAGARKASLLGDDTGVFLGIERPDWVTVKEYEPSPGDPMFWQRLEEKHGALMARTEAMIRGAAVGRTRRLKRQAEGEKLDIDASIEASIDLKSGSTPDYRVYEGISPPERSIAVHLLLDMSQSTADRVGAETVLSIEQNAAAILATAIDHLGDPLAITAFASAGREDLRIVRIKQFGEDLSMMTGMALSGLQPRYSTRIGAGLRVAGTSLAQVQRHRRLVLLITDGEPSDIDVPDPSYLVADARRAVQGLSARGIDTFCIALGQAAGQRQAEIFSRNGFIQIDKLETLPEKLTALYFRMTR